MPKQKERQDTTRTKQDSGKTLDHFFSKKPEPTNSAPFPKRQSNSNNSRNNKIKPRPSNKSLSSSSEIIVIDSDDESDAVKPHTTTRKRRLSEDSDIEIVDAASFPVKRAPVNGPSAVSHETKSAAPSAFTFGKPYLLSNTTTETQQSTSFAFGVASSILGSPDLGTSLKLDGSTATGISSTTSMNQEMLEEFCSDLRPSKEEDTQIDLDLTEGSMEDWLMGDDEIGSTGNKEEDDDDDIEFVDSTLQGQCDDTLNSLCPCCEKNLSGQQPSVRYYHA